MTAGRVAMGFTGRLVSFLARRERSEGLRITADVGEVEAPWSRLRYGEAARGQGGRRGGVRSRHGMYHYRVSRWYWRFTLAPGGAERVFARLSSPGASRGRGTGASSQSNVGVAGSRKVTGAARPGGEPR